MSQNDALVQAAMRGDLANVKRLAKLMPNINMVVGGFEGMAALHAAAIRGHLGVVQWLAREARADVLCEARDGGNVLLFACGGGHEDVARFLIDQVGVNVNSKNRVGMTALYVSADQNQAATARVLIEEHADVNLANKDSATPLFMSAQRGNTAVMRLLLAAGADVAQARNDGSRPLSVAAQNGRTASVRMLLGASANVNASGFLSCTTLYWSSMHGCVACVRLLLCYGRADMSLIGDAPNNQLARDVICLIPESNKDNASAIRAHFDTAERWEREREAAMRDGVVVRSRRRTLRPLRRIYGAIPEHLLSK